MKKLTAEEEQSLLAYCQANPGQSYSALRLWVQTTMGKSVVKNTIGNILKRHGYDEQHQRKQQCSLANHHDSLQHHHQGGIQQNPRTLQDHGELQQNGLQQDDRRGKRPASDFSPTTEPPKTKTAPSPQPGLDSVARLESKIAELASEISACKQREQTSMARLSEMETKTRATEDDLKKQLADLSGELAAVKNRNGKLLRCYRSVKNTFDEVVRSVDKWQSLVHASPTSLKANVGSEEIEPSAEEMNQFSPSLNRSDEELTHFHRPVYFINI